MALRFLGLAVALKLQKLYD